MDIINKAREFAKQLQDSQEYKTLQVAREINDNDEKLQDLIGSFNLVRMKLINENDKENRDEKKVAEMNTEMNALYREIMDDEKMKAYNLAKEELDSLSGKISSLITRSLNGEDPETIDLDAASCSGSCSSCSGCN